MMNFPPLFPSDLPRIPGLKSTVDFGNQQSIFSAKNIDFRQKEILKGRLKYCFSLIFFIPLITAKDRPHASSQNYLQPL
jgi:hypothetical protein